ncbi:Protein of unknown function [Clostridium cavendishii DSM 21758]|uniref:DUF2992 family protein n=1 Tax=Clostridium cavendishii DSM 21758 TaxID=1121302 RepID=A0A1M6QWV2_9CLOT|nr:YjdF family protein [Clostridium cavendishii]SHK24547.1 Protein of unknown function [Clostridium cavendishii DSM 21758]
MISVIKLTVLFENPFWIGVFEAYEDEIYKVCKVTFGPEPKDEDVIELVLRNFYSLSFSSGTKAEDKDILEKHENPKRLQRRLKREATVSGIGTKAQIALKQQHEEKKIECKKNSKLRKEEELERKFQIKHMKRREKHKGH